MSTPSSVPRTAPSPRTRGTSIFVGSAGQRTPSPRLLATLGGSTGRNSPTLSVPTAQRSSPTLPDDRPVSAPQGVRRRSVSAENVSFARTPDTDHPELEGRPSYGGGVRFAAPAAAGAAGGVRGRTRKFTLVTAPDLSALGRAGPALAVAETSVYFDPDEYSTHRHVAAASKIESLWRGIMTRRKVREFIEYNYSKGSIDKAREYSNAHLKKDVDGNPLPLNMPTGRFRAFGPAVEAYMHFVERSMYLFLLCFVLAIPGMITMGEGHDMDAQLNALTILTLGNATRLKVTMALMEFVISGVLVRFLFWARAKQVQEGLEACETEVTPSDFSVMLKGLPPTVTEAARVANFLQARWALAATPPTRPRFLQPTPEPHHRSLSVCRRSRPSSRTS